MIISKDTNFIQMQRPDNVVTMEEAMQLFNQLKSDKSNLNEIYSLLNYYFRDTPAYHVPQKYINTQDSGNIKYVYPRKVTNTPRVISQNASSMFAKQLLPLNEKSITITYDSVKARLNQIQTQALNLLENDLTEVMRSFIKDRRTRFFEKVKQLTSYFLTEGTVGMMCSIDEERQDFVLDILLPNGLYFVEELRNEPKIIFYETEKHGINITKEFGVTDLEPNQKYKVVYYFRPLGYDLKDSVDLSSNTEPNIPWELSIILEERQEQIGYTRFSSRPVFISRLGRFDGSQYGSGNGIAALNSSITMNSYIYDLMQYNTYALRPPTAVNAQMKIWSKEGYGLNRKPDSINFCELAEQNIALQGTVPPFQQLLPATIDAQGTAMMAQRAELEISQAFGFMSLQEGIKPPTDSPTATEVNRESFITTSIFEQKSEMIYNEIIDGVLRRVMSILSNAPMFQQIIQKHIETIMNLDIDINNYTIEYFSSATEQGNLIDKQRIQEYINNMAQLQQMDKITPVLPALAKSLNIERYTEEE
jgi:hypothetical protein